MDTLELNAIDDNFSLSTEAVDSFKKLLLITNVEKSYNITISIDEAVVLNSINDYARLLIRKNIDKNEI